MTHIGLYIRAKRKKLGLTQKDIADKLKVTNQFINNIEGGRALLPPKYGTKLAQLLKEDKYFVLELLTQDWMEKLSKEFK